MRLHKLNSRGDTLVEVMLAVAILSAILGATYGLSSYSARVGQASKERTQAVAYAQQQAEIIKAYAARDWDSLVEDLPPQNIPHRFDDNWELQSGARIYANTAANYTVATTLTGKECGAGICQPNGSNIQQLHFEVTVTWQPALAGPVDAATGIAERDFTKLVVKVSPAGIGEITP